MDAFTRRVELEDDDDDDDDDDDVRSPQQPVTADTGAGDDNDAQTTPDDDQVVPGQEQHLETVSRRSRRPFYEGMCTQRCPNFLTQPNTQQTQPNPTQTEGSSAAQR